MTDTQVNNDIKPTPNKQKIRLIFPYEDTSKYKKLGVKWDSEKNKCFAGFVVSGKNVGVDETITVSGEALSFLSTGIDTRVYFIKNF